MHVGISAVKSTFCSHCDSNVSSYTNTHSITDVLLSSKVSDVISSIYTICNNFENKSDNSPIVLELLIDISNHITVPYNINSVKIGNVLIRRILICV